MPKTRVYTAAIQEALFAKASAKTKEAPHPSPENPWISLTQRDENTVWIQIHPGTSGTFLPVENWEKLYEQGVAKKNMTGPSTELNFKCGP